MKPLRLKGTGHTKTQIRIKSSLRQRKTRPPGRTAAWHKGQRGAGDTIQDPAQGKSGQRAINPHDHALQTYSWGSSQARVQDNWHSQTADSPQRASEVAMELPQEPRGAQVSMADT